MECSVQLRDLLYSFLLASAAFGQYAYPATTYYVDGAAGSDSNSGTGQGHAFATITKAMSVMSSGQSVAVSGGAGCGSPTRYPEQVTFTATNQGLVGWNCDSLIDNSDPISAGAWSKTASFTNIYQATVTVANVLGFIRAWENGTSFIRATSQANLDATASAYTVSADPTGSNGTSFTLFVHASDGSNPGSNGKVYEYNARGQSVFSNFSGSVAVHLKTRRNLGNNGSFQLGPSAFASDITATDGTKHNALMDVNSTYQNFTLTDSYYGAQGKIALVMYAIAPKGENGTIINAKYTETLESGGVGFYGHNSTGGTQFGTVTLTNCSTGAIGGSAVSGFGAQATIINGGSFSTSINLTTAYALVKNATVQQINIPYPGSTVELDTVTSTMPVVGGNNGNVFYSNNATGQNLNVHDSSFSNPNAFSGAISIGAGTTFTGFTMLRNTFAAAAQQNHIGGSGAVNVPVGSTINNNIYHYPTGLSTWINYRGTAYNIQSTGWAAWQALGYDASGSRVTP